MHGFSTHLTPLTGPPALLACRLVAVASFATVATAQSWNACADFSNALNPNGAWSYGVSNSVGELEIPSGFVLCDSVAPFSSSPECIELELWSNLAAGVHPSVWKHSGSSPCDVSDGLVIDPGTFFLHPASTNRHAILRWTAPACGAYALDASFAPIDTDAVSQDVHVLVANSPEFAQELVGIGSKATFQATFVLAEGDTVDLTVGYGSNGHHLDDSVALDVTIDRIGPSEVARAGTPANPPALLPGQTSGPSLGSVWDPVIDHTTFMPGAVLDLLIVSLAPTNQPLPPLGTLLCLPPKLVPSLSTAPGTPFTIAIPETCNFAGLSLCTQGVSVDTAGMLRLTNALDITLG